MRAGKALAALLGVTVLVGFAAPTALGAPTAVPAWSIQSLAAPTNFAAGEGAEVAQRPRYQAFITNSGGVQATNSLVRITDILPAGLEVKQILLTELGLSINVGKPPICATTMDAGTEVSTVSCELPPALLPRPEATRLVPGDALMLEIQVAVPASVTGTLRNRVEVEGGGAKAVSAENVNRASGENAKVGFEEFNAELTGADGRPVSMADSHPYQFTTSFGVNLEPTPPESSASFVPAQGDLKEVEVALPPGLAANPSAIPRCSAQQFTSHHDTFSAARVNFAPENDCPPGAVVGMAIIEQLEGEPIFIPASIDNLVPPKGMPAQFGFEVAGAPVYINTRLRSDGDYGATAFLHNVTQAKRVTAARFSFWGVPWEQSHDPMRGVCTFSWEVCPVEDPAAARPFLRLPSSCASPLSTTMSFETWLQPATFGQASYGEPAPIECEAPPFIPTIESKPTTNVADAPSGLHFDLHLPQAENEDPEGLGEADLKDAKVTLPEGLLVNPASADGLASCSLAEIGYKGIKEGKPSFSTDPADCPDASKVGSVEINAPAVDHPLPGAVYLAKQNENPFNSLIAIYITVNDPQTGVVVKLAGEIKLNPTTGQLTTAVSGNPQVPFEDFKLDFFEGARAPLRTPPICGVHTTVTSMTPWTSPAFGADATPSDSFQTTTSPSGGTCPTNGAALPNAPRFEAGTTSPIAGAYTPFVVHLSRRDGSQEFKGLNLTLPAGVAAKFAGVAECSDAAIAAAEAKSGKQEQSSPSCPTSSHLGTVTVGAGAGPAPYYVKGDAYLAGPYKGAPLSMAIITPAVAGPFDLGTVVVRAPLYIDPETAQGTVKSSLPTILQGIPLDVRSIAVAIDRQDFTLNPTSCEAKAVTGEAISTQGQSVPLNNRFQVGGCQNLGFKPKLSLKLKGGTRRGAHPSLTATVTYPKGGAYSNIAYAQVALPHSEFLDQGHIGTVCTRVQFAAKACPARSIYGYAKAITPLFDKPLEGPVYLRSSSNQLPDLVADLNGQVNVVLNGKNDSIHGGLRNTFEAVPDAPVSKFTLTLKGAKKGLLQNSTNICKGRHVANARFVAQNGRTLKLKPRLKATCPKPRPRKHKEHKHR